MTIRERNKVRLERIADIATRWIGSTASLIFHTIFFIVAFLLPALHVMSFDQMLLVLTTVVSLEAIYLAIFIQMAVNKNTKDIEIIQEDVEEIQEDIEEIQEDVDEILEDVEEIQEDLDEIQEDVEEIQEDVEELQEDSDEDEDAYGTPTKPQPYYHASQGPNAAPSNQLAHIENLLVQLQKEIAELKKQ